MEYNIEKEYLSVYMDVAKDSAEFSDKIYNLCLKNAVHNTISKLGPRILGQYLFTNMGGYPIWKMQKIDFGDFYRKKLIFSKKAELSGSEIKFWGDAKKSGKYNKYTGSPLPK